jgi:hypothetical protein
MRIGLSERSHATARRWGARLRALGPRALNGHGHDREEGAGAAFGVRRPGTREVLLIDPRNVVAASEDDTLLGTRDSDRAIDGALRKGRSYADRENDPRVDRRDFEFVTPVTLFGARYAYEVTYDHKTYDGQLNEVRRTLALVGLLALFGGGAVFYVVGGRRLMRDHRSVLRRATRDGLTDLPNQRAFQDELPGRPSGGF